MNAYLLFDTIRRRLQVLNLRAAQYGINVPPEVTIEAEDLTRVAHGLRDVIIIYEHGGTVPIERQQRILQAAGANDLELTFDKIQSRGAL